MKKIALMVIMVSLMFVLPVFAVETTPPPTTPPVTMVKPTDIKTFDIKMATPVNGMPCPMIQGGQQSCPMMNGAGPGMMMNPGKGKMLFKRMGNNMGFKRMNVNSCQAPKAFRWIGMGIKFIACLLFWFLLIVLIIMAIRWAMKPHHHWSNCCKNDSSLDILKERYAKGEITAEEFDAMKAKLS